VCWVVAPVRIKVTADGGCRRSGAAPGNGTIQLEPGIGGPHRGWDQPARGNTGADALGLFRAARD
jgi:hypothetical protein